MTTNSQPHTSVDQLIDDLEDCCDSPGNFAFMSRNDLWYVQFICRHGWYHAESFRLQGFTHSLIALYKKVATAHKEFEPNDR